MSLWERTGGVDDDVFVLFDRYNTSTDSWLINENVWKFSENMEEFCIPLLVTPTIEC